MSYVSSVTERAFFAVDYFLNRAMVYAWEATLRRRQPDGEEDYGGGDICSLPECRNVAGANLQTGNVDADDATSGLLAATYDGREYVFCGKGCLLEFRDDPEGHLAPDHEPAM